MLCDDCRRIENELFSPEVVAEPLDSLEKRLLSSMPTKISREDFGSAFSTMTLKQSLTSLELSAGSGCELCLFFHTQVQDQKKLGSEPPSNGRFLLNRTRNPYKIREYLATGDHLELVLESAPGEPIAQLDIFI